MEIDRSSKYWNNICHTLPLPYAWGLYPCYNSASLRAWGLSYRVTDAGAGTTGPLGVRGWERRRAPRHKRSRAASDRAETRVASLANALEDSMRAVHHACRADALRVVRHEGARGVAARVVGRVDAW